MEGGGGKDSKRARLNVNTRASSHASPLKIYPYDYL